MCGLFCKKNRFAVEKEIDGGKNGLIQVFRNISGGNGGSFFSFINKTERDYFVSVGWMQNYVFYSLQK